MVRLLGSRRVKLIVMEQVTFASGVLGSHEVASNVNDLILSMNSSFSYSLRMKEGSS